MRRWLTLALAALALVAGGTLFQRHFAGNSAESPRPPGSATAAQSPVAAPRSAATALGAPSPADQAPATVGAPSPADQAPATTTDTGSSRPEEAGFGPIGARPAATVPVAWRLPGGPALERRIGDHRVTAEPAHLDTETLGALAVGERLALELPGAGPVEVVVQRVAEPGPGIRVIQGHLAELEEDFPFVLTLSAERSFANVTTPGGTWIGEFEDGSGWLQFDDLEQRLVNYAKSDMRLPPAEADPK